MKQVAAKFSLLVMLPLLCALPASAKGPADVSKTIHNLSTSAPYSFYAADAVTEVCVFCHTPHGGRTEGPLWNRGLPNPSFDRYSSATLSPATQSYDGAAINSESLLCLSCHDGSLTLDHLLNPPNELNGAPLYINGDDNVGMVFVPGGGGGVITGGNPGTDLSDDHPISISYATVLSDPLYAGGARDGQLNDVTTAEGKGVRFFGGAAKRLECSSCHDPHVDYETHTQYAPFLIMPNAGSALCLACHNK